MKTQRRRPNEDAARSVRPTVSTLALAAALAAAGCADDPLAPEIALTADAPALQAAFLIGQSPLLPASTPALKKYTAADGSPARELEAAFEVSAPALADGDGSYVLRTAAALYGIDPKDDPAASVDPKVDPVATVDPKVDPVATVDPKGDPAALVVIALPIDDGSWAAIDKSTPKAGDLVDAVVTAQLILVAKDGSETLIDEAVTAGTIDPKDEPVSDSDRDGEGR